jgi:hypothetical protein
MNRGTETFADWQLERFRLGELPEHEQRAVASALERDAGLRERVEALDRGDREILDTHPPRETAEAIRARLAREATARAATGARGAASGGSWSPARRPVLAAAAASAVAVGVLLLTPATRDPEAQSVEPTAAPPSRSADGTATDEAPVAAATPDTTRVKGRGPRLVLYRQAPAGPERLADGAPVHARDVIQLLYVADGQRYGVVMSVDGRGVLSVHLPTSGPAAAELEADNPVVLASAWELDDAPAFERFFFVTSPAPFAVDTVTGALRRAAPAGFDAPRLDLPPALAQSTFVLRKDGSR